MAGLVPAIHASDALKWRQARGKDGKPCYCMPLLPTAATPGAMAGTSPDMTAGCLRGIDIQARPIHAVGAAVPPETARQVRAKLAALIAI